MEEVQDEDLGFVSPNEIWRFAYGANIRCFDTWDEVENKDSFSLMAFSTDDCFLVLEGYRKPNYRATFIGKALHYWVKIWSFRHQKVVYADLWEKQIYKRIC